MAFMQKPILALSIVDFAIMPPEAQMMALQTLIGMLGQAVPEDQNFPSARIWNPMGDGGTLTFWENNRAALQTALELSKRLETYNRQSKTPFRLRIGLHTGAVVKTVDFDGRENVWGPGVGLAMHIAGLAQTGQILASESFFRQTALYVPQPGRQVTWLGRWWVEPTRSVVLYNVFITEGAGLPPVAAEEWYRPFQHPLTQTIRTYEAMLDAQTGKGLAFRAVVLAKRLLDLDPHHTHAREVLAAVSTQRYTRIDDAPALYDVFFSELSFNALLHFVRNSEFRVFASGAVIVEEGDKADMLMMVVSGEIAVFVQGNRLREPDPDDPGRERDIVFREGHITGEMGLFNPSGTRSATLLASCNTVTLSLDYRFLQIEASQELQEKTNRFEIQRRIWAYYCARTIENQVNTYPLFQKLSSVERNKLINAASFLPSEHGQPIQFEPDEIWDVWIIVAAGCITVHSPTGAYTEYCAGDCMGLIRLLTPAPPYAKIEVAPDTHLICFPWETVPMLRRTSPVFRKAALVAGGAEQRRLGLG